MRRGVGSDIGDERRPRVAILSYSDGLHDARSQRLARTLRSAGSDVVVYARAQRGLPPAEYVDGTLVRRVVVGFAPPLRVMLGALNDARLSDPHSRLALLLVPLVVPTVAFLWLLGVLSMLGDDNRAAPTTTRGWFAP